MNRKENRDIGEREKKGVQLLQDKLVLFAERAVAAGLAVACGDGVVSCLN